MLCPSLNQIGTKFNRLLSFSFGDMYPRAAFSNLVPSAGVRLTHTYKIELLSYFNTFSVMHSGPFKVVTSYCFI